MLNPRFFSLRMISSICASSRSIPSRYHGDPQLDAQIEEIIRKLKKRGFSTDSLREFCPDCQKPHAHLYKLAGRIGGRDIRICMGCHKVRSYRRNADGDVHEDVDFDLEKFLA